MLNPRLASPPLHPCRALLFAAAALAVWGCRCEPGPTGTLRPELDPSPKALDFEGCPTRDEQGNPVQDVYPEERKVTVRNLGKVSALLEPSFSGPGKDVFSLDPQRTPEEIGPGESIELPIRFAPVSRGETTAELVLNDGDDTTEPVSVSLIGNGRNLPAQPTIQVALENKDTPACENDQACPSGHRCVAGACHQECFAGGVCTLVFPDTFYKESAVLTVRARNTGCPALKVTAMEIDRYPGPPADDLAFYLDQPAVPPTKDVPMVLTAADGTAETVLKVRFTPEKDSTGDGIRYALLRLKTNDPYLNKEDADPTNDGVQEIVLIGNGIEPAIYSTPTFCNFSEPTDPCGNATKQPNSARFEIKNSGSVPVTIESVQFQNGGVNGRFAPVQNLVGAVVQPGVPTVLEITHTDAPLFVTDLLTLTGKAGTQPAGKVVLALSGGIKPCLSTDPTSELSFDDPPTELTTKQVKIQNGAGCGDLIVKSVSVDPQPFFSVVEPLIPAGTTVSAGTAVIATVQYKKPVSGGSQATMLHVDTNASEEKSILLRSSAALDQLPVAVLKGCLTSEPNCSANGKESTLSVSLAALGTTKELTMFGADSFDPGNTAASPISGYLFRLARKPPNAQNATLENNGQRTANANVKLSLDPASYGDYYVVTLEVFDDKDQKSFLPAELRITVSQ